MKAVNDNTIRSKAEPSVMGYFSKSARMQQSSFGTPATPSLIGSRPDQNLMSSPTLIMCSTTPDSTHEPGTPPSPSIESHDDHDDVHAAGSSETKCARSSETPPSNDVDDNIIMNTPPTPYSWIDRIASDYSMRDDVDDIAKVSEEADAETPQSLLNESRNTSNNLGISDSCTPRPSPSGASSVTTSRPPHNFFRKYPSSSSLSNTKRQTIDASKVKVSRPVVNKKRKQQTSSNQLFLDFGQDSFGKQTLCNICGMLRVHGLDEDDIQHDKICKDYQEGVTHLGWKNERVVVSFGGTDDRILEVRSDDPLLHRTKVVEVQAIVNKELGFARRQNDDIDNTASFGSGGGIAGDVDTTCYLYISKKRVVGLMMVKRIQRAYELLPPGNKELSHCNDNKKRNGKDNLSLSISRSLKPSRALLGIHQIWVHKHHRHCGIASKLVSAARDYLIFGMSVPIELIAFSSPTEEGLRFAKSYVGSDRPLIYDIH
jgi:N-acetyltransferase